MSDEEPPPISLPSVPSTSKSTCMVAYDSEKYSAASSSSSLSFSISSFLTLDFDKLSLDSDLCEGRYDKKNQPPGPQSPKITSMPPTEKTVQYYRTPVHKVGRFLPYDVPFKLRRRRKTSTTSKANASDFVKGLLKIKLKGDVEALRMCIFDKDNILPKPCSIQAARPPSPEEEEVDELSEYFTHFVRVELKMSSLAESMYV